MKNNLKEGDSTKKPAPANKQIQTQNPISERDEVKKAETKTQNLHKSSKK